MTAKSKLTVVMEPGLLTRVRVLAARRGQSVSALLADEMSQLVREEAAFISAKERALELFTKSLPLGGKPMNRQELHDRRRFR